MAELREAERHRQRGADRRAHHRAGVRVDARGDIDGDRRAPANEFIVSIARRGKSFHLGIEPGAEDRVDDRRSAACSSPHRDSASVVASITLPPACDETPHARAPHRPSASAARAEQNRAHREAVLDQPRAPRRIRRRRCCPCPRRPARPSIAPRKPSTSALGDRLARARHQRVRRDAVLFLAEAIEFAALGGVEQNHHQKYYTMQPFW